MIFSDYQLNVMCSGSEWSDNQSNIFVFLDGDVSLSNTYSFQKGNALTEINWIINDYVFPFFFKPSTWRWVSRPVDCGHHYFFVLFYDCGFLLVTHNCFFFILVMMIRVISSVIIVGGEIMVFRSLFVFWIFCWALL
jgi:hypothetical protein